MSILLATELPHFLTCCVRYHTVSTDPSYSPKRPSPFVSVGGKGVALRDLAFHEKHAACVDAAGNLYQWGDGFFGDKEDQKVQEPVLTLIGKVRDRR